LGILPLDEGALMVEGETTALPYPAYCNRWKTRLASVGNNNMMVHTSYDTIQFVRH